MSAQKKYNGIVFGFYHQRNAGDDRLAQCIERMFSDANLTFLPHTNKPPLHLLINADFAIIGGGSVANAYYGIFEKLNHWAEVAKIPVFCLGIGVSDKPSLVAELKKLARIPNRVWVRDIYSYELLDKNKNVIFAPDLSWLYPLNMPHTASNGGGICLNVAPSLKSQIPIESWRKEITNLTLNNEVRPWPLHYGLNEDYDLTKKLDLFDSIQEEFSYSSLLKSDFLVGMRYHAILFSIQLGKPFVPVYNTKKLELFLQQTPWRDKIVLLDNLSNLQQAVEVNLSLLAPSELYKATISMQEQAANAKKLILNELEDAVDKSRERRKSNLFSIRKKILDMLNAC
jgi:hypothetical protein